MDIAAPLPAHINRSRLWAEFLALYVGVPVAMAAGFGLYPPLAVLAGLTVLAIWLLNRTSGFAWRELLRGPVLGEWPLITIFALGTAAILLTLVWLLVPNRMFELPLYRTDLWLMIMMLYPVVSVLPQELIFKPLFFRRYGGLFPSASAAIIVSGLAFGLGHLFYMNPVAIGLTTLGGMVMSWAYLRSGSFLLACILHALAGQMIFTSGLGVFFYHGAIPH